MSLLMQSKCSKPIQMKDVPWNKLTDNQTISIPKFQYTVAKRSILSYMASIYDSLSIISRYHVLGKVI